MNVSRTTTITLSIADIIHAIKARHPEMLDLQAFPDGGVGVVMTSSKVFVTLTVERAMGRHDAKLPGA